MVLLLIFCTVKEPITRVKMERKSLPTKWEKVFATYSFDRELISRICKKLKKLNTKRTDNPVIMN
jgi:hypothetical protein